MRRDPTSASAATSSCWPGAGTTSPPSWRGCCRNLIAGIAALARADAPVVCAVQGVVAGGGVGLVSSADIVLAGPEARFAAAFSAIGLCADSGGSYFLPRRVGSARATEFFLLNETWSAERAQALGLVNRIVPAADLAATALDLAATFARGPTSRLWRDPPPAARQPVCDARGSTRPRGEGIARLVRTDDAWEGINALLGKRAPQFTGR